MLLVRGIATAGDMNLKLYSALIILAAALVLFGTPLVGGAEGVRPLPSAELRHVSTQLQQGSDRLMLAQEYPAPPFYELLPHDYPYPLIRTCYTYAGICLIPFTIRPGAPCYCEASNGVRVEGVCTK